MKLKLEQGLPPESTQDRARGSLSQPTKKDLDPLQTEAKGPRAEARAPSGSEASAGVREGTPQGLKDQSAGFVSSRAGLGVNGLG